MNCNKTDFIIRSSPTLIYQKAHESYPELTVKINFLGRILRDVLFYPLNSCLGMNAKKNEKLYKSLQTEIGFYTKFWKGNEPTDLNLKSSELIRKNYIVYDQPVVVSLEGGKKITASCRIVESKDCPPENVFNALVVPGNLSTHNSNLIGFYDFLVAHSKQEKASPVRFFVFGHYEMQLEDTPHRKIPYIPPTLDAAGEILKRTIITLEEKYGKLNLIHGHSLGCITIASMLKKSGPELLPALFHFDRGPSSIHEASKTYWFGWVLDAITRWSGLAIHIDEEIRHYFKLCKKADQLKLQKSGCIITGVENDFVFPNKANLATCENLNKLQKRMRFAKWVFNPPSQMSHSRAHHAWRLMNFNKSYLTSSAGNVEMHSQENLAQTILRLAQKTLNE